MRKACFALTLVLASFLGGAAVNGPGLGWLKTTIRARIESPEPSSPTSIDVAQAKSPPRDVPAAPLPVLTLDRLDGRTNPSDATSSDSERSVSTAPTIEVAAPSPKSDASPLDLTMPDTLPPSPRESPLVRTADPAVAPAASNVATSLRDWSDLRRRMRELGVSRYEVAGEPGGRSRFRCLIPLAGRRAVGQQFEGEGDDDFSAAEAALHRVALWKATEMPPQ